MEENKKITYNKSGKPRKERTKETKPRKKKPVKYKHNIDPEELRRLYIDENMSRSKLAKYFGCSVATIDRNLRRIELNKPEELSKQIWVKPIKFVIDLSELYQFYKVEKHTIAECCDKFNAPDHIIRKRIHENGWELNRRECPSKEEIEQYYIIENHSHKETADKFELSESSITRLCAEYGIVKPEKLSSQIRKRTFINKYGFGCGS